MLGQGCVCLNWLAACLLGSTESTPATCDALPNNTLLTPLSHFLVVASLSHTFHIHPTYTQWCE